MVVRARLLDHYNSNYYNNHHDCVEWSPVTLGALLPLEPCHPWNLVTLGTLLPLEPCYPWNLVTLGTLLPLEPCHPWNLVTLLLLTLNRLPPYYY